MKTNLIINCNIPYLRVTCGLLAHTISLLGVTSNLNSSSLLSILLRVTCGLLTLSSSLLGNTRRSIPLNCCSPLTHTTSLLGITHRSSIKSSSLLSILLRETCVLLTLSIKLLGVTHWSIPLNCNSPLIQTTSLLGLTHWKSILVKPIHHLFPSAMVLSSTQSFRRPSLLIPTQRRGNLC